MSSGAEKVGGLIRQMRQGRGMELTRLSHLSGVHRATLHRWERGETLPRLPELNAVFAALKIPEHEQQQVFASMNNHRARVALHTKETLMGEQQEIGSYPHGGDLLRAMRLRCGLSYERMAFLLHVSTRTIRLWEKAEVWLSVENLHQVCSLLRAQEPEIAALTCGRVTLQPRSEEVSLEAIRYHLDTLRLRPLMPNEMPRDLEYLALTAQSWSHAAKSETGQRLLAEVYACYADYLLTAFRPLEMHIPAERTLALMTTLQPKEDFWLRAGIVYAQAVPWRDRANEQRGHRNALKLLADWLPFASDGEEEASLRSLMALYLVITRDNDAAVEMADATLRLAERTEKPEQIRACKRRKANVFWRMGQPEKSLPLIEWNTQDTLSDQGITLLLGARAYLAAGKKSEAHDWLQHLMTLIAAHTLPSLHGDAEALACLL